MSIIAAYTLNNTKADAIGNFNNLTDDGSGGLFTTDKVNRGDYSYYITSGANKNRMPSDVVADLAARTTFEISIWAALKDGSARQQVLPINAVNWDTGNGFGLFNFYNQNTAGKMRIAFGWDVGSGGGYYVDESISIDNNFHRYNFSFNNGTVKFYIDGTLKYTLNSQSNVFGSLPSNPIIGSDVYGNFASSARYDYLIVTDTLRNGADADLSSGKAGIRYGFVCGGNPRVKIGGTN